MRFGRLHALAVVLLALLLAGVVAAQTEEYAEDYAPAPGGSETAGDVTETGIGIPRDAAAGPDDAAGSMIGATETGTETSDEEKRAIDGWIDDNGLNQYGDDADTMYAGGSPLFDESTGTRKDRFAYVKSRHPTSPWMTSDAAPAPAAGSSLLMDADDDAAEGEVVTDAPPARAVPGRSGGGGVGPGGGASRFPAHWGPEPQPQTRDYRTLPGGYGFGSGTLAKWIQKNMDEDAAAAAEAGPQP